jgi:hypothetical protein
MVTIDDDTLIGTLTDKHAVGTLNGPYGVTAITPQTARRIACDADLIPAVLATDGTILDLGRSQRTWSTHQRRAARSPPQLLGSVIVAIRASRRACEQPERHGHRTQPTPLPFSPLARAPQELANLARPHHQTDPSRPHLTRKHDRAAIQ